ncbi:MAG TPA: hypothetical protein VH619_12660 [Verrucomicrobiae bacterium]|nr:hypothetical protein [Verrucomicrobiae bacterium]
MRILIRIVFFLLALSVSGLADVASDSHVYPNGFSIVIKLAGELYTALPAKYGEQLDAQTVALQPQELPVVAPISTTDDNHVLRQVCLSAGFIDVVNHICHAKAADRIEPGFFDKYVKTLSDLYATNPVASPPSIANPAFWSDDVMNDQSSYFNQVIGLLTAINLSHHYLGHYAKYSDRMIGPGGSIVPINNYLTAGEWNVSVKAGAADALNCALATDGPRALFEAFDQMQHKPAWAAYIVPPGVDLKKLNKQLVGYETDFFHGKLTLR